MGPEPHLDECPVAVPHLEHAEPAAGSPAVCRGLRDSRQITRIDKDLECRTPDHGRVRMAEQFLGPPVPSDHDSPVVEHRQGGEVRGERIVVACAELRHPHLHRRLTR